MRPRCEKESLEDSQCGWSAESEGDSGWNKALRCRLGPDDAGPTGPG